MKISEMNSNQKRVFLMVVDACNEFIGGSRRSGTVDSFGRKALHRMEASGALAFRIAGVDERTHRQTFEEDGLLI